MNQQMSSSQNFIDLTVDAEGSRKDNPSEKIQPFHISIRFLLREVSFTVTQSLDAASASAQYEPSASATQRKGLDTLAAAGTRIGSRATAFLLDSLVAAAALGWPGRSA